MTACLDDVRVLELARFQAGQRGWMGRRLREGLLAAPE